MVPDPQLSLHRGPTAGSGSAGLGADTRDLSRVELGPCFLATAPISPPTADLPVVLTRPLEPKSGRELQSVILSCDFKPPPKAVQWYKEDTPLAPSDRFKMKLEGQMAELRILRLTPADAGIYRCQAGGADSSAEVTVDGAEQGRGAGPAGT